MNSHRSRQRTHSVPKGYQFISVKVHQSQREKELTLAQIRQHASRASRTRPYSKAPKTGAENVQRWRDGFCLASRSLPDSELEDDPQGLLSASNFNPWLLSRGYRNDPFESIPGSNETYSRVGFNFLIDYCFPAANMINYAFHVASIWSRSLLETMAYHAHTFHSVMAMVTAAHEYLAQGNEWCRSKDALYHKLNAISELRRRLSEPHAIADDAVVLTMLFLGVTDIGLGHIQDQIVHSRQALSTIRLRGGISGFKNNVGMTSLLVQFEELKKDTLLEDWAAQPNIQGQKTVIQKSKLPQTVSASVLHDLPTGFYRLAKNGHISETTCTIVLRLRHLVATDFSIPYFDATNANAQFAGFSQACPPLGPTEGPLLEKLVCLAVLRHAANTFGRIRNGICPYDGLREALMAKVLSVEIPDKGIERQTLIWVWLVAIEAFSSGGRPSVLADRGMDALHLLPLKFPETQRWQIMDFEAHARKFLWHNATNLWLRPAWERVTGALHSLPPNNSPRAIGTAYLGCSLWPTHPHFPLPSSFRHVIGEITDCLTAPDHQHVPIRLVENTSLSCSEPPLPKTSTMGLNSTSPLYFCPSTNLRRYHPHGGQPAVVPIPHPISTVGMDELLAAPMESCAGIAL